jgi:hypothetical protein
MIDDVPTFPASRQLDWGSVKQVSALYFQTGILPNVL